jgi:excisionase family DNA binding protein
MRMSTAEQVEQTNVEPLWLTYPEAQKLAGLGRTTLWMLINDPNSGVKAARVGRAVRISRRSLEEYMERQAEEFE